MNNNQVVAKVGDREITRREVEEVLRHVDRGRLPLNLLVLMG